MTDIFAAYTANGSYQTNEAQLVEAYSPDIVFVTQCITKRQTMYSSHIATVTKV